MQKLLAADVDLSAPTDFKPLGTVTIPLIITGLVRLVMILAALAFFFMLVIGGIRWITSGGDKAQTEAARNQITAALVGLVVVFSAWAISALLNTFFGINILGTFDLPSFFAK